MDEILTRSRSLEEIIRVIREIAIRLESLQICNPRQRIEAIEAAGEFKIEQEDSEIDSGEGHHRE